MLQLKSLFYLFIFSFSISLMASCSVFSPVNVPETTHYTLNQMPASFKKFKTQAVSILVTPMRTSAVYNTSGIAYTTQDFQIAYFARSDWIEPPAQMLQLLIAETLQNTGYFQLVGVGPAVGAYSYILNTQLLALEQVFQGNMSHLHLHIRAQLIKSATGKFIATREFDINESVTENTPYGGVLAANRATERFLRELSKFCEYISQNR